MNAPTTYDSNDPLRGLLTGADPFRGSDPTDTEHTWARIVEGLGAELLSGTPARPAAERAPGGPGPHGTGQRSFPRRHWQAGLLIAAGVASLALAAGTALPGLGVLGESSDSGTSAESSVGTDLDRESAAGSDAGRAGSMAPQDQSDSAAADSAGGGSTAPAAAGIAGNTTGAATADPTLVRTASVIVGTNDLSEARDAFVATVARLGGTLVSETVTSKGGDAPVASSGIAEDKAMTYPGYPSGPGIWLTVKVPAAAYDQTLVAAKSAGEVAQLQQSSYDVGAQVTDVRARIVVLTASLKRLQGLLGEANGVSDVIRLENAIAERQAELDSLLAQQRDLADQTQMSQVSLTLLSPDDAQGAVDPDPQLTWWESFVQGMVQFWSWLGQALLIVSPVLIVGSLLWWVRRRRAHGAARTPADEDPTPDPT